MKKRITFGAVFGLLVLASCGPTRFVEPLAEEEFSFGGSFGGPLIDYAGVPIPVPLSQIELGYGLRDDLTLHGGIHATSALFGNLQLDAGATYQVFDTKKIDIRGSVSPSMNLIVDFNDRKAKAWPILDFNFFWNYGKRRNYIYLGGNFMFDFAGITNPNSERIGYTLFSPMLGHTLKGKERSWEFFTEIKIIAPYMNSETPFVPYTGITGRRGGTGIYIGFRKILSKK